MLREDICDISKRGIMGEQDTSFRIHSNKTQTQLFQISPKTSLSMVTETAGVESCELHTVDKIMFLF